MSDSHACNPDETRVICGHLYKNVYLDMKKNSGQQIRSNIGRLHKRKKHYSRLYLEYSDCHSLYDTRDCATLIPIS
jgi:hypothetical protein